MNKTEQIISTLQKKDYTTREIAEITNITANYVKVVLNRLIKRGILNDTGRYRDECKIYSLQNENHNHNSIDTKILQLLIPVFVENELIVSGINEEMKNRIIELYSGE